MADDDYFRSGELPKDRQLIHASAWIDGEYVS
jgi:hypothetical protein